MVLVFAQILFIQSSPMAERATSVESTSVITNKVPIGNNILNQALVPRTGLHKTLLFKITYCFEIIVTSSLNLKMFFATLTQE